MSKKIDPMAKITLNLVKHGFDIAIELTNREIQAVQSFVLSGNKSQARLDAGYSDTKTGNYVAATRLFQKPEVALYTEYCKHDLRNELELNAEAIAKRLAAQLSTSAADLFDKRTGKTKNLRDVSDHVLAAMQVSLKYDNDGTVVPESFRCTLPDPLKVLEGLLKLADIDPAYAEKLRTQVSAQTIKLRRTEKIVNKQLN